jgi:hypothetical protein
MSPVADTHVGASNETGLYAAIHAVTRISDAHGRFARDQYRVFSHPVDSVHISASANSRITANRCYYQAPDKQSVSLTLTIGCANTLYAIPTCR